ncbi:hypothetical protein BDR07DRAFT_1228081, partial [Suillus spraguei]
MSGKLQCLVNFIIHLHCHVYLQVRFALSSITSWWSMDGDFDYQQFWRTIIDFFEKPPGQEAQHRVDKLLKWWTRCVI